MTTTPKTKDELLLENALLKQRELIGEDVKKLLNETLQPLTAREEKQDGRIGDMERKVENIWLKIWAISGTMSAFCGVIGFAIGLYVARH